MEKGSPESRTERFSCAKLKVKTWEAEYVALHGCRPNKDALAAAPQDIRTAYKVYCYYRKILDDKRTVDVGEIQNESTASCDVSFSQTESLKVTEAQTETKEDAEVRIKTKENAEVRTVIKEDTEVQTEIKEGTVDEKDNHFPSNQDLVCNKVLSENDGSGKSSLGNSVWGRHLNKTSNSEVTKVKPKEDSLYNKMAEKLRASGTVKVRTSLKKLTPLNRLKRNDSILPLKEKDCDSSVPIRNKENISNEPFDSEVGINGNLDAENVNLKNDQLTPKDSVFGLFQNEEADLQSSFPSCKVDDTLVSKSLDNPRILDDSVSFKVTKNANITKSSSQSLSLLSSSIGEPLCGDTVKKKASLNRGWLARCIGADEEIGLEAQGPVEAEDWKMKIADYEWTGNEQNDDDDDDDHLNSDPEFEDHSQKVTRRGQGGKRGGGIEKSRKLNVISEGNGMEADVTSNDLAETTRLACRRGGRSKRGRPKKADIAKREAAQIQDELYEIEPLETSDEEYSNECIQNQNNSSKLEDYDDDVNSPYEFHENLEDPDIPENMENPDIPENVEDPDIPENVEDPDIPSLKRKRGETLEELELKGKIQSVWPPPKKVRRARKQTAKVKASCRKVEKIRNAPIPIEIEPEPSKARQSRKRALNTRARRKIANVDGSNDSVKIVSCKAIPIEIETGPRKTRQIRRGVVNTRTRRKVANVVADGSSNAVRVVPSNLNNSSVPNLVPSKNFGTTEPSSNGQEITIPNHSRAKGISASTLCNAEESNNTQENMQAPDKALVIKEYDELEDIEASGSKGKNAKVCYSKEEHLRRKITSGSANNNFVRINLKKKTYVRGKKYTNFKKYKHQEWKKRKSLNSFDAANASGNKSLTCFKCGDFGHFARYCPGKKGDGLRPLEEYDESESTFLSLEDAAALARGIKPSAIGDLSKSYPSCDKAAEKESQDEISAISKLVSKPEPSIQPEDMSDINTPLDEAEESMSDENGETGTSESVCVENIETNTRESINVKNEKTNTSEAMSVENGETGTSESMSGKTGTSESMSSKTREADGSELIIGKNEEAGTRETNVDDEFDYFPDDDLFEGIVEMENSTDNDIASSSTPPVSSYSKPPESNRPTIDPLYDLDDNGEVKSTPDEVFQTLRMFGYESFRIGQENAIMRILSGLSTLLVLSTGSGKSLCYQLPAYLYAKHNNCITLCISPLVSLMEDQVLGLPKFLQAVCLHTHQNNTQRTLAVNAIRAGTAQILLVSPEAIVGCQTGGMLGSLLKELPPVAFACLDEAHCVSQWSHNFRPSYLRVCQVLREKLGVKTILGLTATARHATAISIADHLLIQNLDTGIIRGNDVPSNLFLSVSRDENREQALLILLQGDRFCDFNSIIIYCTRRDECERVATLIRTQLLEPSKVDVKSNMKRVRALSFDAEAYHAGLSSYRRQKVQKQFMSGKLRIVVATVAFGMGIDKSDVRGIIHFNMPKNIESYVQEIGRAGRDGKDAHCHLFLDAHDGRDIQELKRHIFSNSLDRHIVRKLLTDVFKPCACLKVRVLAEEAKASTSESIDYKESGSPNPMESDSGEPQMEENTPELKFPVFPPSSCPKHEVAISISNLIQRLDLPEENIETILCYLQLHWSNLVKLNSHVYANCNVACYGGPRQLVAVSRRCPPLAAAIALKRQEGITYDRCNRVSFPVVEIASKMGWNSKIVKRELKALEWNTQGLACGQKVSRSGVSVEFDDLSFHLEARGDLTEDECDQLLDAVFGRVQLREKEQLRQLCFTYQLLHSASHKSILMCCEEIDNDRRTRLFDGLHGYFAKECKVLSDVRIEEQVYISPNMEQNIRCSVRSVLSTHLDHQWTGRAIARVFHGIGSPNFPAEVWGRVRRIWRSHLNTDFNLLVKIATQEILRSK